MEPRKKSKTAARKTGGGACNFCLTVDALGDASRVLEVNAATKAVTLGGKPLDDKRVSELASEARAFRRMELGRLFVATQKAHAVDIGMTRATTMDHVMMGKAMAWNADLATTVMDALIAEDDRRRKAKEARESMARPQPPMS
jgi:hypothetical protein